MKNPFENFNHDAKKVAKIVGGALIATNSMAASNTDLDLTPKPPNAENHNTYISRPVSIENTYNYTDSSVTSEPIEGMYKGEIKEGKGTVEINLANYFETDKADIREKDVEEVKSLLKKYFRYINKKNLHTFLSGDAMLLGSSDPRKTNTWKDGNYGLTKARLEEVKKIIDQMIKTDHDLFNAALSNDEKEQIKNKLEDMYLSIPMTFLEKGFGENGVKDYHEIINPKTGTFFTSDEWADLSLPENIDIKKQIFQEMRKVSLSLSIQIDVGSEKKLEQPKDLIPEDVLKNNDYKQILYVIDASPSMDKSKKILAEQLRATQTKGIDRPISFYTFTDKVEDSITVTNQEQAAEAITQLKINENQDQEYGVKAIRSVLEKIPFSQTKKALFMQTDEILQKVSRTDLQAIKQISAEKNVDIFCTIKLQGTIYTLTLDQLETVYEIAAKEKGVDERIKQREHIRNINVSWMKKYRDELAQTSDRKKIKEIDNLIKKHAAEIVEFEQREQEWPADSITIDNTESIIKKVLNQK